MPERSERYTAKERTAAVEAARKVASDPLFTRDPHDIGALVDAVFGAIGMKPVPVGDDDREWQPGRTMPRRVDYQLVVRLTDPVREVHATWWRNWEDPETTPDQQWCWREAREGYGPVGVPIEQNKVQWWRRA